MCDDCGKKKARRRARFLPATMPTSPLRAVQDITLESGDGLGRYWVDRTAYTFSVSNNRPQSFGVALPDAPAPAKEGLLPSNTGLLLLEKV